MASILSAGTTSATAMVHTADTSGVLQLASNNGTVGLTLDTSQRVLLGTTAAGTSLVQATQAGINATSLTTTTIKNIGLKLGFTGVSNTDGYIFGGVAMGGTGEEYAGIVAYDNGSSAATGLKLFTGTTGGIVEAVNIDSVGRMTRQYQPAFSMSISGTPSQTISAIVPFSVTQINVNSCFDTGTYTFTAPVAGNYLFAYSIRVDGYTANNYFHFRPLKNGAVDSAGGGFYGGDSIIIPSNSAYTYLACSWIWPLAAGDTVKLRCESQTSVGTYLGYQCQFSGYMLG